MKYAFHKYTDFEEHLIVNKLVDKYRNMKQFQQRFWENVSPSKIKNRFQKYKYFLLEYGTGNLKNKVFEQ